MKRKSSRSDTRVVRSSGNVFADLNVGNADEKQTRVRLAVAINQIVESSNLSQTAVAKLLGINQPKVSALANYRLDGFSVERLLNFLTALGQNVEIVITPLPRRKPGAIRVTYPFLRTSPKGYGKSGWDFIPMEIRGETVSESMLRDRGQR